MSPPETGKTNSLRKRAFRYLGTISIRRKIIFSFGIIILITVLLRLVVYLALSDYQEAADKLSHTYKLIKQTKRIDAQLSTLESNVRGFIISGKPSFLENTEPLISQIEAAVAAMEHEPELLPEQRIWVAKLWPLVKSKIDISREHIQVFNEEGQGAAALRISSERGKRVMDTIRSHIAAFEQEEDQLLTQRVRKSERLFNRIIWTNILGTLFNICFLLLATYLIFLDLKRQKGLETELRDNELRLRQFLEALPIGVTVMDKTGRLNFTNAEGRRLLGAEIIKNKDLPLAEQVKVSPVYKAGTNEKYPAKELPLARALGGENSYTEDMEIRSGGKRTLLAVTSCPVYNLNGDLEFAISGYVDITERKKNELELQTAKEEAEQSSRAKERFLANMSHEIRTPLNAIIGFAGLLSKSSLTADQKQYNEAISSASESLLTIVNDILDFSKIEAGMMQIEQVPFSVAALLDSIEVLLGQKAKEKKIGFTIETDTNVPPMVVGDPVRLTQILLNVGGNAIKFTEKGHVRIHASVKADFPDKAMLIFRVSDTGIGISPENVTRIFERFNQESSDTTRKFGGTGLGLSIVKSLVEMHGGEIALQSELGIGSVFTLLLPYKKPTSKEMAMFQEDAPSDDAGLLKGLSVLVAEDNVLNQKLVERLLQDMGLSVDIAANGKAAVEMITSRPYDFVLMDMQMPVMDGYEAATTIRQQLKSDVPIIAMTAHAMQGEKEKCLRLGMNDYIAKPLRIKELHEKLTKVRRGETIHRQGEKSGGKDYANGSEIDFTYLMEATGGNNEFISELLTMCMKSITEDIAILLDASEHRDMGRVKHISHKMQSTSSMAGVKTLTETLKRIELLTRESFEYSESIAELVKDARMQAEFAVQVIQKELDERDQSSDS